MDGLLWRHFAYPFNDMYKHQLNFKNFRFSFVTAADAAADLLLPPKLRI